MCSKKYIYANLHKIIRFYVVHNKITTIYNKKEVFRFIGKPLFCVGATGFEPATTWSQTRRATGLRYTPFRFSECKGRYNF